MKKQHMYTLHGMQKKAALSLPYQGYQKTGLHLWRKRPGIFNYFLQHFFFLQGHTQLKESSILETSSHERFKHIALRLRPVLHCVCLIIVCLNPI